MDFSTTLDVVEGATAAGARGRPAACPTLVVAWSAKDPGRVGEVLAIPSAATRLFGRGAIDASDRFERVALARPRPGRDEPAAPLADPFVSRAHWTITREGDALRVVNLGKRALALNGAATSEALVRPGDVVAIDGRLVFVCLMRAPLPAPRAARATTAFGEADADGIVGEAPATWALRDEIAFLARRHGHVLVTGASGAGKELVARAIHARSARASRRFVSRNAATIPSGLVDAELFGNVAGYPNPGMPERPGLVGEADGGTLFLDEIGEMLPEAQAHLLRVADAGGEYQRLGDAKRRTSDLRIVAATNRPAESLKHDVLARFPLRIHVPGLDERREDVPLLVRHLLRAEATRDEHVRDTFLLDGEPRIAPSLAAALVRHRYTSNVRELAALVWSAIATSPGGVLDLTDRVQAQLAVPAAEDRAPAREIDEVTSEEIRAALAKHDGVRERVWRELGLSSRHVLNRLMRRYAIDEE